MPPLARVALGLVIVVLDLRFEGVDLMPDPVGWALVLWGLVPLAGRHRGFGAGVAAALVGALLSVPQVLAEPGEALGTLQAVVETVLVFGTCTAIGGLADEARVRTTANRIRWTDLGLTVVLTGLASLPVEQPRDVTGVAALAVALGLATLVVMVWFLVFLLGVRHRPAFSDRARVAG